MMMALPYGDDVVMSFSPVHPHSRAHFPALKEGGSLLEYILSFERLVAEYESVSTQKYQADL